VRNRTLLLVAAQFLTAGLHCAQNATQLLQPNQSSAGETIPICTVFQNLPAWNGKHIAVRGIVHITMEGTWLSGDCEGAFITDGYRWPVSLTIAADSPTIRAPDRKRPIPAKNDGLFRGRKTVIRLETWVGTLRMDNQYKVGCRPNGEFVLMSGFGHLNSAAAELRLEEVRDPELMKAPPEREPEEWQPCRSPEIEQLCAKTTNLAQAAYLGCRDLVSQILRTQGIDSKGDAASAALKYAIRRGDPVVVKMLLDAGAPVNPVGVRRDTPLKLSVRGPLKPTVMKLLLGAGAKIDRLDDNDELTLLVTDSLPMLRLLLDAGGDPNAAGSKGTTPLMWTSGLGYEYLVALLLERGAVVDQRDSQGRTALMHAAMGPIPLGKFVDAIPLLLKAGADPNARDHKGRTALDLAQEAKHEMAVEMLRPHTSTAP